MRPKACDGDQYGGSFERLLQHCADTAAIVSAIIPPPLIVDLIVGTSRIHIPCHRALLAYHSKFFDCALYGGFAEARKAVLKLPEEDEKDIKAFISWLYAGDFRICHADFPVNYLNCDTIAMRLWVLGDKLLAPKFSNDAMHCLMNIYRSLYAEVDFVEHAYAISVSGSKLRLFIRDLICANAPLSVIGDDFSDVEDWIAVLAKGGDLVLDCTMAGGFTTPSEYKPLHDKNQVNYLEEIVELSGKDWLSQKFGS